jgi:transcriptional regulator with XRE-family HTH domain
MQAGLSQERLGSAAGVDARTISDIERSVTRYPRAETVHGIADALELTPAARENWLTLAAPAADAAVIIDSDVAITEGFAATR